MIAPVQKSLSFSQHRQLILITNAKRILVRMIEQACNIEARKLACAGLVLCIVLDVFRKPDGLLETPKRRGIAIMNSLDVQEGQIADRFRLTLVEDCDPSVVFLERGLIFDIIMPMSRNDIYRPGKRAT